MLKFIPKCDSTITHFQGISRWVEKNGRGGTWRGMLQKRHDHFTSKLTAILLIYIRAAQDWGEPTTFHPGRGKGS